MADALERELKSMEHCAQNFMLWRPKHRRTHKDFVKACKKDRHVEVPGSLVHCIGLFGMPRFEKLIKFLRHSQAARQRSTISPAPPSETLAEFIGQKDIRQRINRNQ